MKKEGIMRINSYNKFFAEVAKIMNTDIKAVKQLDGRCKVELANHVYLNVYRGASGTLFVHDHRGIARITSCYDFDDFKTMKDLYERLVTDYSESEETIKNREQEEAAKPTETTHTPTLDFEYRNLMHTDEYKSAHNTPSTQEDERDRAKYLMETHSFPSTAYKRHSYKEVDKVCGDCSHFNACMQGYQTVAPTCCMFDSLYRARKNPNWHNVSLATLANIDFDMLDEKRQTYLTIYRELQQTLSYLRKCKTESSYYACLNRYLKKRDLYANKISANMFRYTSTKLSMQNVESGVWASECEEATGYHESRRYNKSRVGK